MTPPGSIVTVWEGGELALGVLAGEEKRRVRLILQGGREIRVQPGRIGWVVEASGPVPGDSPEQRREAGRRVERAEARLARLAERVDVAVLWELAIEAAAATPGHAGFEAVELAELALDERSGEAKAALVRALRADALRFARKGEAWVPRERQQVEDLERERERVATRERETARLFESLRRAVHGEPFVPSGSEFETRYLEALEQLATHEDSAPEAARAMALEALEASGQRHDAPHEGAFRLLRAVGRFADEDVNLQIRRYGLRTAFSPEVLEAAERAARDGFAGRSREDLTGLESLSIDGPRTREIDDALSLEPLEDGWRLGVHIADPSAFVRPGDALDAEALSRGLTHFHPDGRLPMLPPRLAEDAASLVAGQDRPALSFLVELDPMGQVRASSVVRSVVRVVSRLDYERADRTIESGRGEHAATLDGLARLGRARRQRRAEGGALLIRSDEVDVWVDGDGTVRLERIPADSPSRGAVGEAMILAGALAAAWCRDAGLPAIYRRQAGPQTRLEVPVEGVRDPVEVRRVRRALARGEVGVHPGPHHGLGLEAYAQVTSPLRRYQDLAVHRQIVARLAGLAPPYDVEAMQRIAATTEQADIEARRAERAAEDYWLLRYLEARSGETVEGIVVEVDPRPVVLLVETLREQPMPALAGVAPGDRVALRIERVNPRAGRLALRRVD